MIMHINYIRYFKNKIILSNQQYSFISISLFYKNKNDIPYTSLSKITTTQCFLWYRNRKVVVELHEFEENND